MNQRQRERLEKVAQTLEAVNPRNFNLNDWFDRYNPETGRYQTTDEARCELRKALKEGHKCGTTACVAGYFPVIFPRSWHYDCDVPKLIDDDFGTVESGAREFFGITDAACNFLFYPTNYPVSHRNAKYAAKRVRAIIANGGDAPLRWKNQQNREAGYTVYANES